MWLKSGGYLIVDEMEALTAIDVNTGRFVGKRNLEDTITKTNLEACARGRRAAAHPRHIGGMIVVDFIDMDRPSQPREGHALVQRVPAPDRAKAAVTRISELGLIEMTRKRTRESLLHHAHRAVPALRGQGLHQVARRPSATEILRELRREGLIVREDAILVSTHPEIADLLLTADHEYVEELEKRLQKQIIVRAKKRFHLEKFEIQPRWAESLEKEKKHEPREAVRAARAVPPREPAEPGEAVADAEAGETAATGEAPAAGVEGEGGLNAKRRRRRRGGRGRKRLREGGLVGPVSPEQMMNERASGSAVSENQGDSEGDEGDDGDEPEGDEPAGPAEVHDAQDDESVDSGDDPVRPPGLGDET